MEAPILGVTILRIDMGALRCISRTGLRQFLTTEDAYQALERWYTQTGAATFSKVEPAEVIFFDGGGSVFMDEPIVEFAVDGIKFKTFARQIPFIRETLIGLVDKDIPGCVKFGGANGIYVVTEKTRRGLIGALDTLWSEWKSKANELEDKMVSILNQAGVVYVGKCSCQSGQLYKECCGRKQLLD